MYSTVHLLRENIEKAMCSVRGQTITEIYRVSDGRFCTVQSVQDQPVRENINILERTRDMEVNESLPQGLADEWAEPTLTVSGAGGRYSRVVVICGLEYHILAKEEKAVKEEMPEATHMAKTISEIWETKGIRTYNQDIRRQALNISFKMEICS